MIKSYFDFMLADIIRGARRKEPKRPQGKRIVCCKCGCTGTLYKHGERYICRTCREKNESGGTRETPR